MRTLFFVGLAGFALCSGPALAADCTIEQVGKRYHAQLRITRPSGQELTISGGPVFVYQHSGGVRLAGPGMPYDPDPGPGSTFDTEFQALDCDNGVDVAEAVAEQQRNYNECRFVGTWNLVACSESADGS